MSAKSRRKRRQPESEEAVFDLPRREAMSLLPTGLPTALPGLGSAGGLLGGGSPTSAAPTSTAPTSAADAAKHLAAAQPQNSILNQNTLSPGASSSSGATQYSPVVQSNAPPTK